MGTLHTIDTRPGSVRTYGDVGVSRDDEIDLPTWEDFASARDRFFAALQTAPRPAPRTAAGDGTAAAR
ncbi:MAG: hypothetical protein AB7I08_09670 [Thermoleophilia bacterium]